MTYRWLTNGADVFSTREEGPDYWNGVTVNGQWGNDNITLGYKPVPGDYPLPVSVHDMTAYAGAGHDIVLAVGTGNTLFGGAGNDSLTVIGIGNTANGGDGRDHLIADAAAYTQGRFNVLDECSGNHLNGGGGADTLESHSGASSFSDFSYTTKGLAGTTMSGGAGTDTFVLRNSSDLIVTNDTNGSVSNGDMLLGVIDVITDYRHGETLDIHALTGAELVALNREPQHFDSDTMRGEPLSDAHLHLVLGDGQHASFRGDLTGDGQFTVSDAGHDLLVAYDVGDGTDSLLNHGAVVLQGVTSESDVLFA